MKAEKSFQMGLAERLRDLMEGETQMTLAEKLNVSQGNVAKYLAGAIIPRSDVLLSMMKSMHVNPTWFLSGKGPKYLGKGYDQTKGKSMKASSRVQVPYGVTKELASLEKKLEKIALNSPDLLREVKVFLQVLEQNASLRQRNKQLQR